MTDSIFKLGEIAPPFIALSCVISCIAALAGVIAYVKHHGYAIGLIPAVIVTRRWRPAQLHVTDLMIAMGCCFAVVWWYMAYVSPQPGFWALAVKLVLLLCPLVVVLGIWIGVRAKSRADAIAPQLDGDDTTGYAPPPPVQDDPQMAAPPVTGTAQVNVRIVVHGEVVGVEVDEEDATQAGGLPHSASAATSAAVVGVASE